MSQYTSEPSFICGCRIACMRAAKIILTPRRLFSSTSRSAVLVVTCMLFINACQQSADDKVNTGFETPDASVQQKPSNAEAAALVANPSAPASINQTHAKKQLANTHQVGLSSIMPNMQNRLGSIDNFAAYVQNGNMVTAETPLSTFSIDVDSASYTTTRQLINRGLLPQKNSVRVEELVNYFDYDYPAPLSHETPFTIHSELAPSPYNQDAQLLRIGIQGYQLPPSEVKAKNLVFLIDVSGSMAANDKLPLLKQAMQMLTQSLTAADSVSIVTYANGVNTVLDGSSGNDMSSINYGLAQLGAAGGTNGGRGLEVAYQLAKKHFIDQGVNQVLLATDGDFNLGQTDPQQLINFVSQQAKQGVGLTTLGFGVGSSSARFNDALLEQLSNKANGRYVYIDNLNEARKVLHDELSHSLDIIAADVKIQLEFNPAVVAEYRLIGYENRQLQAQDFNNDKVDAGEVGAGHSVTALYEIRYNQSRYLLNEPLRYQSADDGSSQRLPGNQSSRTQFALDEIGYLKLRYKPYSANKPLQPSQLISHVIASDIGHKYLEQASDDFRFAAAVAGFGQLLNQNHYVHNTDYDKLILLAQSALGNDSFGYRHEFLQIMRTAKLLTQQGVNQVGGFYDPIE